MWMEELNDALLKGKPKPHAYWQQNAYYQVCFFNSLKTLTIPQKLDRTQINQSIKVQENQLNINHKANDSGI